MSYLIIIVSFFACLIGVYLFAAQVIQFLALVISKKTAEFSFSKSLWFNAISFVLACLAVYINHWPKR